MGGLSLGLKPVKPQYLYTIHAILSTDRGAGFRVRRQQTK